MAGRPGSKPCLTWPKTQRAGCSIICARCEDYRACALEPAWTGVSGHGCPHGKQPRAFQAGIAGDGCSVRFSGQVAEDRPCLVSQRVIFIDKLVMEFSFVFVSCFFYLLAFFIETRHISHENSRGVKTVPDDQLRLPAQAVIDPYLIIGRTAIFVVGTVSCVLLVNIFDMIFVMVIQCS